ncbi:MAG TPA: 30S ribosomal protein S9 [Patescibacteria group bacterium]|nr:30S ribosomal protein S9 [Patescibacteria group bacterium]
MEKKTTTTKTSKAKATEAKQPKAKAVKAKAAPAPETETTVISKAELKTVDITTFPKLTIPQGTYLFAVGRRKTAVTTVRLYGGKGESTVNGIPFKDYFSFSQYNEKASKPLALTGTQSDIYFSAITQGGGKNAQAEALRGAISKALAVANPEFRPVMKKNGFLTRDDRKKERKKPGLKRARRRPQWAKR